MDDELGVRIKTEGCEATWFGTYTASAPVIEILQDYCEYFGLSAAACKLYANRKEVPKNKLLGQALPRAYGECWLTARVKPTLSFYIDQSLNTHSFTSMTAPDSYHFTFNILQAVAMGFAKEDSFTSGALNPDAFKELLTLSPQQVLPFHMHMADGPTRHLIVPHLQGPVKALVMLVQVLQLAVERFSHFKPAALHDQMEQVCRPKQAPLDHAKQADRQEGTGSAQHTYEEAAAVAGADPAEEAAAVQGSPDDGHNTESSEAVHADQEACQTASAEVHLNDAAGAATVPARHLNFASFDKLVEEMRPKPADKDEKMKRGSKEAGGVGGPPLQHGAPPPQKGSPPFQHADLLKHDCLLDDVLAAYHKSDLSVAKRTVHRLRSLVLVAKLASLLYLGEGTLPFGGPLRLFWSIAGSAIGSTEGAKDGAENRADEEAVARLEVMKVHVLLPPLRKGVRGLEGAAEGGFEDADEDARMAASTSVCMYRQIFSNHQLLDKKALAQELYRAGAVPVLMRALGLGWEVSENTYWLLGRMLHHDPPMRAVLARMQGPLHLSKVLTLRLALPGQGGRWSDAATLAKTKLIGRVLANTALTASQRIEQATEISAKYNPRHLGPMKYDECDMFITILEGAVDLMSLLLQENPLSQLSVAEPKQDDQESPAPQAALNSPLESPLSEAAPNSLLDGASPSSPLGGSTQGSPVSQAQAGPCSEAASDSPSSEDVRSRPALPLNQAQTPACLTSTSLTPTAPTPAPAPSSPVSPADTPPMPAKAANTNLDASTMVVQQPLGKHVQLGHLHEDAPGLVTCNWQTPPAATWKQISTMAVRAVDALQFVLQQRAIDNTQVTATAADGCETKLVQLLLQLLQGHFSDVTLDFQPILHGGISPIVRLLDGHGGGGREGDPSMTLVTLCLERMTLDAVQGRLQEDSDGLVCAQQLCSMLAMLGKKKSYHEQMAELAMRAVYALPIPEAFYTSLPSSMFSWCYDVTSVMELHPSRHVRLWAAALVLKYWHHTKNLVKSTGGVKAPQGSAGRVKAPEGPAAGPQAPGASASGAKAPEGPDGGPKAPGASASGAKAPEAPAGGPKAPEDPELAGHTPCSFSFCYLPLFANQYIKEIYQLLQRTLQEGPWTQPTCAALTQALSKANLLCQVVPAALPQASLGLGQSLKECLAKVYELPVGKPAQDALLKAAIPFVVTLAVDADSIKDLAPFLLQILQSWSEPRGVRTQARGSPEQALAPSCLAQQNGDNTPVLAVLVQALTAAPEAEAVVLAEVRCGRSCCTDLLCAVAEQTVHAYNCKADNFSQDYSVLTPFIALFGFYAALPSLHAGVDIFTVYARAARAVTRLLLMTCIDLMQSCGKLVVEAQAACQAVATMSPEEAGTVLRRVQEHGPLHQHLLKAQESLDVMVKHLHRACTGYREWKVAVAQAFQGSFVSTTKSADHDAVVRAYAAVDPDNRKQVRFTVLERMLMALYRDGHLEASWGMLKDIFPELQKYKRHELVRQAGQSDAAQQLAETEASSYNTALARVEQQAKADAKKAKKQRQKAKKQLTQTPPQAAALAPRSAERDSDTSQALSTEPEPSARGSSEAPGDTAAPVEQSHAAEVNAVRLHGGQATSRDSTDAHMLDIFRCPISKGVMVDPVIAGDGHTYERAAITAWLVTNNSSPVTQTPLPHPRLVPNLLIKGAIASQRQQLRQAAEAEA